MLLLRRRYIDPLAIHCLPFTSFVICDSHLFPRPTLDPSISHSHLLVVIVSYILLSVTRKSSRPRLGGFKRPYRLSEKLFPKSTILIPRLDPVAWYWPQQIAVGSSLSCSRSLTWGFHQDPPCRRRDDRLTTHPQSALGPKPQTKLLRPNALLFVIFFGIQPLPGMNALSSSLRLGFNLINYIATQVPG
jgi:hypothetical protein